MRKFSEILLALVAIFSFIFSIYSYIETKDDYAVSYSQSIIKIFDYSEDYSGFSIEDAKGNLVESDIYAVDVRIWNSGNRPVISDMISRPFNLAFCRRCRVLQMAVPEDPRSIYNNQALKVEANLINQFATLSWRVMEPKTGIRIQAVYAADRPQQVSFAGHLVSIGLPEESDPNYTKMPAGDFIMIIILLPILFSIPWLVYDGYREYKGANQSPTVLGYVRRNRYQVGFWGVILALNLLMWTNKVLNVFLFFSNPLPP